MAGQISLSQARPTACFSISPTMLCVRLLSGEASTVPLGDDLDLSDVKGLKQHLHQLHGMPLRFRQRLLLHGQILDDEAKLDLSVELELILLSYCLAPETEKLLSAASTGSVAEVGTRPKYCRSSSVLIAGRQGEVANSGFWGFPKPQTLNPKP